jgi:kanosamine-6-phosphate phosphatase
VQHILSTINIPPENSLAFGDSGNDLEMLQLVKHGYLVANATEEAKSQHDHILPYPHAQGILSAIQTITTRS